MESDKRPTPRDALEAALKRRVKEHCEVTPDRIEWIEDGAAFEAELFARTGVKADHLVEKRKHHV